jgi:hypothetical protein
MQERKKERNKKKEKKKKKLVPGSVGKHFPCKTSMVHPFLVYAVRVLLLEYSP